MPKLCSAFHQRPIWLPAMLGASLAYSGSVGNAVAQTPPQAPALQVSPVMVQFVPDQMTETLTVANVGDESTTVQIRSFAWHQEAGADKLTPTDDLEVSPPIVEVGANQTQTFRLVLRAPATGTEASYRLLLDELPPPAQSGSIRIALRLSIPVFAAPAGSASGDTNVAWHINLDGTTPVLVGSNQGSQHVRIINPTLDDRARKGAVLKPQYSSYILPGATENWIIADGTRLHAGASLHLTAMSDAGPVDTTVNVPPP